MNIKDEYLNVEKFIDENFSDYFNYELKTSFSEKLHNQKTAIAIEYSKIAKQEDRRLFLPYKSDEGNREIYNEFSNIFRGFDAEINEYLSFKNFQSGIIEEEGNIKLTKYVKNKILSKPEYLVHIFLRLDQDVSVVLQNKVFKRLFPKKYEEGGYSTTNYKLYFEEHNGEKKICLKTFKSSIDGNTFLRKKITKKDFASKMKPILETLGAYINTDFLSRKDKKELFLCFSLNYADWLLSSTGNSWSSCLNLNDGSYHTGLLCSVADTNRCMVYLTDKKEKEYKGLKSYNMIKRMWIYTMKKLEEEETYIWCNKIYPTKQVFKLDDYLDVFTDIKGFVYQGTLEDGFIYKSKYTPEAVFIKLPEDKAKFYTEIYYDEIEYERDFREASEDDEYSVGIYEDTLTQRFFENCDKVSYYYDNEENDCYSCGVFLK